MLNLYWLKRKFQLWILRGGEDLGFLKMSSTALLSFTRSNSLPITYKWNLSHAHTTAKASFSIWEYLDSVSVSSRLAYEMILCLFGSLGSLWDKTAPSPAGLASATTPLSMRDQNT